jgi:AraC family transcriptional regulator
MEIRTIETPPVKAALLKHTGPYPGIGSAFTRLVELAETGGLPVMGSRWFALYLDDPERVPEKSLRSAACVELPEGFHLPADAGLEEYSVPGGRFAVAEHTGPYDGLGTSWSLFMGGLAALGLVCREEPCMEFYVKGCETGLPPGEWVTEMWVPVE